MDIVFMGTPDFAVPSLEKLLESGENVKAVYTQPDRPKGRGHKLAFSPVKETAIRNNIEVLQPTTFRDEETIAKLKEFAPDLIVVVAYGKILPQSVLDIPKYGCINVHGSILPKYRGAAPIQWSVLNGDEETGVTTMFMAKGMDTGDILTTAKTKIKDDETAAELYDRLSFVGADLLLDTLVALKAGTITRTRQNDSLATYAPMLSKEMSNIDFDKDAQIVHKQIMGLSDWPCAVCYLDGKRLKVYRSEVVSSNKNGVPGEIIDSKSFVVSCKDNTAVKFITVQYDGSKRMSGEDFLRGKHVLNNSILKSFAEE